MMMMMISFTLASALYSISGSHSLLLDDRNLAAHDPNRETLRFAPSPQNTCVVFLALGLGVYLLD
jgi:hypothetical protein